MNQQLVREGADFGPDDLEFLQSRMHSWLSSGAYRAVIFGDEHGDTVAYALFRENADEIYLAQFLVLRHARRSGVGHAAIDRLRQEIWRGGKRLTLDVLVQNRRALEFWHQLGWRDCVVTLEIPEAEKIVARAASAPLRVAAAR